MKTNGNFLYILKRCPGKVLDTKRTVYIVGEIPRQCCRILVIHVMREIVLLDGIGWRNMLKACF